MTIRAWLPSMAVIGLALTAGCGSNNPKLQAPKTPPPPPAPVAPVAPVPAPVDPITALISTSQQHYETGERELKVGHLDRARSEFDRALDVLLSRRTAPGPTPACASSSIAWSTESTHRR